MECYRRILRVCWKESRQQKCQRKNRKTLYYNGPNKAEVESVWTHLQNGRSATGEDSDVVNG